MDRTIQIYNMKGYTKERPFKVMHKGYHYGEVMLFIRYSLIFLLATVLLEIGSSIKKQVQ